MGKEPGWYTDSRGEKRFWDGSSWTDRVNDDKWGWTRSDRVPFDGPPRGERDPYKPPPPGVSWRAAGAAGGGAAGEGLGFLLVLMFIPVLLLHLLPAFLFWLFYVLRWPLLIAWAAITVVGIRRLINGPRRVKGIAKGVAIWALVGLITVNGFETAWKTANPEPYEVRMARSMLVEITQGAASKVCRVMPEDEARRLAEHYGESSCYDTVVRLGRRYRSFDEEFEDVEITLLGSREMSGEPVGVDSLTVHRARLGENLFGWREIEFVPGLEALVSVRW